MIIVIGTICFIAGAIVGGILTALIVGASIDERMHDD